MKLSRHWVADHIDLSDLSDEALQQRFTEIGHAVESVERHGDDTVYDLEITTNRVDAMAHVDVHALLASTTEWKMAPVARFPGVPMILALTHARDLEYARILSTIRSLDVPYLHEVGLRDRYEPQGEDTVKTTLGMWYQAFDRSLTQEEIAQAHQQLAAQVRKLLPVTLVGGA